MEFASIVLGAIFGLLFVMGLMSILGVWVGIAALAIFAVLIGVIDMIRTERRIMRDLFGPIPPDDLR